MKLIVISAILVAGIGTAMTPNTAEAATHDTACQYDVTYSPREITMFSIPGEHIAPNAPVTVTTRTGKIKTRLRNGEAVVRVRSASVVGVKISGRVCETT